MVHFQFLCRCCQKLYKYFKYVMRIICEHNTYYKDCKNLRLYAKESLLHWSRRQLRIEKNFQRAIFFSKISCLTGVHCYPKQWAHRGETARTWSYTDERTIQSCWQCYENACHCVVYHIKNHARTPYNSSLV